MVIFFLSRLFDMCIIVLKSIKGGLEMTKTNLLKATALSLILCGLAGNAMAADGTGNATARILAPITVTENIAMDFGGIYADAAGDTITLSAAGAQSALGASTFDLGFTPTQGVFDITGNATYTANVTYSSGDTLTGPGTAMPLGAFTDDSTAGVITLDGSGNATLNVGAALTVNAAQVAGTYTGTYTVSVNY